jgi:hypothetical protein
VIPVDGQELREQAPLAYQERAGRRIPIDCRFALFPDGTVGFTAGAYDRSLPLVIDPVLSYSTLLGGSGSDAATAVAVASTGAAYIAGFTDSYSFPTANPAQNYNAGSTRSGYRPHLEVCYTRFSLCRVAFAGRERNGDCLAVLRRALCLT